MGILVMETKNYLSIIRKADFTDLFKYGCLYIAYAVSFDGDINDHQDDKLFEALTCRMNLFEHTFEYLIIHFVSEDSNLIEIEKVQGIYAFDEEAKREMSISFDSRIQIHVSPWTEQMQSLRKELFKKQALRGVDNLWRIFNLSEDEMKKCKEIISDDIIDEVFREFFENVRPRGEQSLWVYLMRYERHSFYPKDMRGFFCDCIHTVCNWMGKSERIDAVAETTALYKPLMRCDDKFASLYKIMAESPLASMTENQVKCRYVVAAPLFLFMKEKFSEGIEKVSVEYISYAKKMGGFECSISVYLLGLTLGYDKTYDAYYDIIDLPILKKLPLPIDSGSKKDKNHGTTCSDADSWRERILAAFNQLKILKKKEDFLVSLNNALDKEECHEDYDSFFEKLKNYPCWKTKKGISTYWYKLRDALCDKPESERQPKTRKKQEEQYYPGLFDVKGDIELNTNTSEEQQTEIDSIQNLSIIDDDTAISRIENCPFLKSDMKSKIVNLFNEFQENYRNGYYSKNPQQYHRNNSDFISHFCIWCISQKNKRPLPRSKENSTMLNELKKYLLGLYHD